MDLKRATVGAAEYEEEEVGRSGKNKWEMGLGLNLWINGSFFKSRAWPVTLAVSNIV